MSDKPVLIIATMIAHPGKGDALYKVLNQCVAPSRDEPGNMHYDLYRSVENSDQFLFHESWKTPPPWSNMKPSRTSRRYWLKPARCWQSRR